MHPELQGALRTAIAYGGRRRGRLIEATRSTAWRWVRESLARAVAVGALAPGRNVGTHTLRHSAGEALAHCRCSDQRRFPLVGARQPADHSRLSGDLARSAWRHEQGAVNMAASMHMLRRCARMSKLGGRSADSQANVSNRELPSGLTLRGLLRFLGGRAG